MVVLRTSGWLENSSHFCPALLIRGRVLTPLPKSVLHRGLRINQEGTLLHTFSVQRKAIWSKEPTGFQEGFASLASTVSKMLPKVFAQLMSPTERESRNSLLCCSVRSELESASGELTGTLISLLSLLLFSLSPNISPSPFSTQQILGHFLCDCFLAPSLLPPEVMISFFFLCF